jgi:hypothetical protein
VADCTRRCLCRRSCSAINLPGKRQPPAFITQVERRCLVWAAWALAARAYLLASPCEANAGEDKSTKGQWGPVIPFPLVPVAAATLKDGRVRTLTLPATSLALGVALTVLDMLHGQHCCSIYCDCSCEYCAATTTTTGELKLINVLFT